MSEKDTTENVSFDLQDLDLSDLTVTSMRDTVALPENGASWGNCSCQGSSSCAEARLIEPIAE